MSNLTANGANDDYEHHRDLHTFILKSSDATQWQVRMDTASPALQPENAPYN